MHRFIVQDTIEERILAAVAASAAEQWSDDCVTLQQLYDLFSTTRDLSVSVTCDLVSDNDHESESEEEESFATMFPPAADDSDDEGDL